VPVSSLSPNKELSINMTKKENVPVRLVIANKRLKVSKHDEKEKRAAELVIGQQKGFRIQNNEKEKRASNWPSRIKDLSIAAAVFRSKKVMNGLMAVMSILKGESCLY